MITEDRLKHIIGVARRCYELAGDMGFLDDFRKRMFIIGFLHDIGYEFSDNVGHADFGATMLKQIDFPFADEIRKHGSPLSIKEQSCELRILNRADIETSAQGEQLTANQRLDDVAFRYGKDSQQYENMLRLCKQLGLV